MEQVQRDKGRAQEAVSVLAKAVPVRVVVLA